ncbi:uncharacterized protein A1O5_00778 [Cladophialophora psammophila CBS 110553]|uniref:3-oxoacyl-[acyl-carrier protein] reductase n=1 Tax=Cladophialophora psammophila CBS 110553 TaxID=1182543 RepID=W9XFZ1_9EURO|nr:uncharacterized protein A1O5_00778 [Cladophialophora psammophila CBS 110553]EXJ76270.1 hypothetical protein A1O5_00778 [Cladophialophora psammophila CBS 110553]
MVLGDFSVGGKLAVITGAGSGINLEFAKLCQKHGCRVLAADIRSTPELEEWLREVRGAETKVVYQQTDVVQWDQLKSLLKVSEREFGEAPDLFVAGAGIFEARGPSNFWEDLEDDHYRLLDVNVGHAIQLTRIGIRELLRYKKKGAILIVGSLAGYTPNFTAPLYVASKHAITGFARSLADLDEIADIKVVACAPGMVYTRIWTDAPKAMEEYNITKEVCAQPSEIAGAMLSLVQSSQWPAGTVLEVAKGQRWRNIPAFYAEPPAGAGVKPEQNEAERRIIALLEAERQH